MVAPHAASLGEMETATGLAPVPVPVAPGLHAGPQRVAHFRILRQLGAGGMGTVYLAHDERMERDVALKVMARHVATDKSGRRFEQEAWIAGRLDHPNLVKVYERGTWEDFSYFSMELIDGGSLADVIDHVRRAGRDEGWGLEFGTSGYVHWAIRMVIDAAHGLDHAHRHGVVHRDVKPMNLLLSRELGSVKLADFGLALDVEATRMTTVGTVMGTISFMAPEQIRGEQAKIDARTDVYALGVTLFELLTLELPYTGKTQQIYMSQVLTLEARRASKLNTRVSRDLETVLLKAMEKESRDRYATAAAFAEDLDNVLHLRPIMATPTGQWKRMGKWVRRKPVHAALVATLVLAVPAAAVVATRTIAGRVAARKARLARLLDEARWLEGRQEWETMLERAGAVLDRDPGNALALRHRALARFNLAAGEKRAEALGDVDRVIGALPSTAWPHTLKAFMLTRLGRLDEARAEVERAARLRGTVPTDEDVAEEARLALERQDPERALELYSEQIRRHPDGVRALSARALVYEELGKTEQALLDYRVAVGLDPHYDLVLIDLARILAEREERGDLEDAEAYLGTALASAPENPFALEIQGIVLFKRARQTATRGDREGARRLYEQAAAVTEAALARSDKLLGAENNLATVMAEQAKLSEPPDPALLAQALERYAHLLARFEAPPAGGQERDVYLAALSNTCDAQITLRRLEEALVTCTRLSELHRDDAVAFYNLAGVHALLGRDDEALAALARDVELGDRDWEYLAVDPWFERLRPDPRFKGLLEEMKGGGKP